MDCRVSLLLGLGLGVLAGAGCTPSAAELASPQARAEPGRAEAPRKKKKDSAKRQPKAETCWKFGDFSLREALAPGKAEAERRQRRDQARRAYQQALQIDPKCLEAQRGLARLWMAEEDHERAVAAYHAALNLSPRDAGLWFELGMAHSRHKEWEPALGALSRASELEPENRHYAQTLGFCLARAGAHEESLACFTRAVGEARAHYNLARMLHHLKQDEAARQHLRLALQKEPGLKEAGQLLARIEAGQSAGPIVPAQFAQPPR